MNNLQGFLKENAMVVEDVEFAVSERFKDNGKVIKWKLKSMTNAESEALRKEYTKITWKRNERVETFDREGYSLRCCAECVVYPDLNNKTLQDSYGVFEATELLKAMLLPGEYIGLVQKVNEVNGFDRSFEEEVEEAKN